MFQAIHRRWGLRTPGRPTTAVRAALLLPLALGTAGCFEVHEEIWVREDGTVRYALDYGIPEFMVVGVTQVDGGNADSALAYFRRPPAAVVEGDSVWNREYMDRDLRHFVSERQVSSLDRLVALAGREAAKLDSVTREATQRDSILQAVTKGESSRRASAIRDSTRRAAAARDSTRLAATGSGSTQETMGQVLGGYEAVSVGPRRIRLVHIVFPRPTRSQLRESYGDEMGRPPSPEQDAEAGRRMLAGRTYSYRLHAPHIVSTNGTLSEDGASVEWSFPMASIVGDSARTLEAVIELKKGK
jgi:hypothetical protein